MPRPIDQIFTVAQMQAAEQGLIDRGISVDELMQRAGRGAAEWVWRIAGGHSVTVLCGPGNNGGDGYVIAERLRERGLKVTLVAATEAKTDAARKARSLYRGELCEDAEGLRGGVLVDCLFGSGLTRGLSEELAGMLAKLSENHNYRIAIDVPSGVESDSGAILSPVPGYDLTICLGAWKQAHFLMPAMQNMGALRLVDIGCDPVTGAARLVARPALGQPPADTHKYRRGLLGIVGGEMPGAALLAAKAAMHGGAGYVKLLAAHSHPDVPAELVVDETPLANALDDARFDAFLAGPGLGRGDAALSRLEQALATGKPLVADADALVLLKPEMLDGRSAPLIVTPHEGEMAALERSFSLTSEGGKPTRALALARDLGAVVIAKGPDTVIAAPDGQLLFTRPASPWLSTAGTGDILAGLVASRLANGSEPLSAASEAVWLHGEAARIAGPVFTAGQLAECVPGAYAACL
jgi:hydroxyethylthiazole kinase-like uncharacterized protein yjeF